ncbi:MAG: chemotaxis protein CheW [Bdellovibrionales bacterium]|nr:chemotaxis protein CheW [Bdellovibrionales bacterium]
MSQSISLKSEHKANELFTTFYVGNDFFGIEVMKVQEVTGSPRIISVPLAPKFVRGLINLRGQLATALGLHELFENKIQNTENQMSVVCKLDGNLVSLIVDSIGDVVEVNGKNFELPPDTLPPNIKPFVKGIYKMEGQLLSVLDLSRIGKELSPTMEQNVS